MVPALATAVSGPVSPRVVFTLSNAGEGSLRLTEAPRVVLKAGC